MLPKCLGGGPMRYSPAGSLGVSAMVLEWSGAARGPGFQKRSRKAPGVVLGISPGLRLLHRRRYADYVARTYPADPTMEDKAEDSDFLLALAEKSAHGESGKFSFNIGPTPPIGDRPMTVCFFLRPNNNRREDSQMIPIEGTMTA